MLPGNSSSSPVSPDSLVPDDANGVSDVFLHERAFGHTRRLTEAEQPSAHPALDAAAALLLYDQRDIDTGQRHVLGQPLSIGATASRYSLASDASGTMLDNHHLAISGDGRYVVYLEQSGAEAERTCQVHFYDRESERFARQPCPEGVAKEPENARPIFSPEGDAVIWFISTPDALAVENPLDTEPPDTP
jgi:hypothetical protein